MENKSWTVTYRNRDNGQRITAAVFAVDQQQAREKAKADGREAWEVESIEPNEETLARILIAEFANKQSGHFACPRCGKMTMDAESVTRNALSRRVGCYICDTCGTVEAIEDFAHKQDECDGKLYVDVDPRRSRPADICTKYGNAFDGEPCDPIPENTIIEFVPERDTWSF